MASRRAMVRYAKWRILATLVKQLQRERDLHGPSFATATDQLVAEFTRRTGEDTDTPPPGHPPLPGMETSND